MPYLLLTLTTVEERKPRKGEGLRSPLAHGWVTRVTSSQLTLPRYLELQADPYGEGVG
jgi:hypothetical protein